MHYTLIWIILVASCLQKPTNGYCWQPGWNPSFSAPPIVTQLSPTTVQVSWKNIINNQNCADQFLVKYWRKTRPNDYLQTDLVATSVDAVIISGIIPSIEYVYQVIAREDKLMGIDYNRSPTAQFATSTKSIISKQSSINHPSSIINAVSVETHKADEKYNPISKVIDTNDGKDAKSHRGFQNVNRDIILPRPRDTKEYSSGGIHEINIILLLALTSGVIMASLVVAGSIYNCYTRLKPGPNLCTVPEVGDSYSSEEDATFQVGKEIFV